MSDVHPVHIIREAASPPEAMIWTMWCGDQCVALDDEIVPAGFDFVHEDIADKATCPGCRAVLYGAGSKTTEGTVPA